MVRESPRTQHVMNPFSFVLLLPQSFHPEDLKDHSLIRMVASAIEGALTRWHNSTTMAAVTEVRVETQVTHLSVGKY